MKPLTKHFIFLLAIFFGGGFFSPAFAHEGHEAKHNHPSPKNKILVQEGKVTYDIYCASCHGVKGDGKGPAGASLKPPATNFRDLRYMSMRSWVDLFKVIEDGRPKTAMPGWKKALNSGQMWNVVAYIQHLGSHRWDMTFPRPGSTSR